MRKNIQVMVVLCLVSACAHWAPTPKAVLRRQAEAKFYSCLTGRCVDVARCVQESVEWCRSLHFDGTPCANRAICQLPHMEASCGTDGMLTDSLSTRKTCANTNEDSCH